MFASIRSSIGLFNESGCYDLMIMQGLKINRTEVMIDDYTSKVIVLFHKHVFYGQLVNMVETYYSVGLIWVANMFVGYEWLKLIE